MGPNQATGECGKAARKIIESCFKITMGDQARVPSSRQELKEDGMRKAVVLGA